MGINLIARLDDGLPGTTYLAERRTNFGVEVFFGTPDLSGYVESWGWWENLPLSWTFPFEFTVFPDRP
jgi:hypothetical protein